MDADVPSPSSPRSAGSASPLLTEWTLVERPSTEDAAMNSRPGVPTSPEPELAAEAAAEHDEQQDGMKSPASERLADDLLREPFQAGGQLHLQLLAPPSASATVEEPSTPTAAAGPYTGSCDNLALAHLHANHPAHKHRNDAAAAAAALAAAAAFAAGEDHAAGGGAGVSGPSVSAAAQQQQQQQPCNWSFERQRERMRLRAAARLSGEGALEGFQDPQDLLFADAAPGATARIGGSGGDGAAADDADGGAGGGVTLGWDALLSGFYTDLLQEWEDVRALMSTTAVALWGRVCEGHNAMEEAVRKAAKAAGRTGCPLWALLGMGGLAAACLAALISEVLTNRRLAAQLRQRDRDLARLVVKILNLQDALHAAAVPLLRHTSCERYTSTTTLIGMV